MYEFNLEMHYDKKTEENYASLALQLATASGRVTSRHPPISRKHQNRCQISRLLRLALGRALASRGLARRSTARERAAVGLRHALLHLHLHLVLLGLGHHLRGLLRDGHVALVLRHLELHGLLL